MRVFYACHPLRESFHAALREAALRWFTGGKARAEYHAVYHLNTATEARRKAFVVKVGAAMRKV
jgi:hypothetical protein